MYRGYIYYLRGGVFDALRACLLSYVYMCKGAALMMEYGMGACCWWFGGYVCVCMFVPTRRLNDVILIKVAERTYCEDDAVCTDGSLLCG